MYIDIYMYLATCSTLHGITVSRVLLTVFGSATMNHGRQPFVTHNLAWFHHCLLSKPLASSTKVHTAVATVYTLLETMLSTLSQPASGEQRLDFSTSSTTYSLGKTIGYCPLPLQIEPKQLFQWRCT